MWVADAYMVVVAAAAVLLEKVLGRHCLPNPCISLTTRHQLRMEQ